MERSLPADRNLARRVYSAFVFVPIFILVTYLGGIVFTCLIAVLVILGMYELFRILEASGAKPGRPVGYVLAVGVCFYCFSLSHDPSLLMVAFSAFIMAAFVFFLFESFTHNATRSGSATIGAVLYVGWFFSLQIPLRETGSFLLGLPGKAGDLTGWLLLLFGYAMVWTCDTSAYFVGKRFGKHKLVPAISPGKTIEGAVGGVVFTLLVAFLFRSLFLDELSAGLTVLLGMTTAVVCQVGDIFESRLKRRAGIKDSSNIIPGHGGILDRFDGMLFALPVIYFILIVGVSLSS